MTKRVGVPAAEEERTIDIALTNTRPSNMLQLRFMLRRTDRANDLLSMNLTSQQMILRLPPCETGKVELPKFARGTSFDLI